MKGEREMKAKVTALFVSIVLALVGALVLTAGLAMADGIAPYTVEIGDATMLTVTVKSSGAHPHRVWVSHAPTCDETEKWWWASQEIVSREVFTEITVSWTDTPGAGDCACVSYETPIDEGSTRYGWRYGEVRGYRRWFPQIFN
jgi:hypothetical protein